MTPDDPTVRHYLKHSMVMRLATQSSTGRASLTPIWFVVSDGALVASTAASTVAARNVAADPRVAVLLDAERAGGAEHVLRLRGTASLHTGLPPLGTLARLAGKYYLAPRGLGGELAHVRQWRARQRYYAQSEAVWIEIRPDAADLLSTPRSLSDS